jgi:hypothetical protein
MDAMFVSEATISDKRKEGRDFGGEGGRKGSWKWGT